jgi:hypothetical protein
MQALDLSITIPLVKWLWGFLWNNIGGLGGLIIDNENIPAFQLPNDHFDVFLQTAISVTGIGAIPGYELLYESL